MSRSHDYPDEMRFFEGLSDEQVERILGGRVPVAGDDDLELARFIEDVREGAVRGPGAAARGAHLAAMAEAARVSARDATPAPAAASAAVQPMWRKVMSRTVSFALKVTAAAGAGLLSMAGLAYAGMDLPGTSAEETVEKVLRVELPNQDGSRSDDVHATQDSFGDERGCEFGQAVAATASGKTADEEHDPCSKSDDDETVVEPLEEALEEEKVRGKSDGAPYGNAYGRSEDKVRGKSAGAPYGNANGQSDEKTTGKPDTTPVGGGSDDTGDDTGDGTETKGKSVDAPRGNANGQSEEKSTGKPEGAGGTDDTGTDSE
jgi:hypothetical protein